MKPFRVVCITEPTIIDWDVPAGLINPKVDVSYTVIDAWQERDATYYELAGFEGFGFISKCFRKLDDDFGSQIAEKIEKEINTKKLVEHG